MNINWKSLLLPLGLLVLIAATAQNYGRSGYLKAQSPARQAYHSGSFLSAARVMTDSLPEAINNWFATSGTCDGCHGSDPLGLAMVTANNEDVNPTDDWRSSMMANSARDPFWRAQVSHEIITTPNLQTAIEDKCLACHAPMGRYSHYWETGQENYAMAQLDADTFGMDGVSCLACHTQVANSSPEFSGIIDFDTTRKIYGQYPGPVTGPMSISIGFDVEYGPHIQQSEVCASCHSLVTHSVDLSGNLTGRSFFEQATYHEWLNSTYALQGQQCQGCHVPQINENIIIAAGYNNLSQRRPYGKHHLQGANVFMLRMMRDYRDSLGIAADSTQFDSTIARTERMLREETLDLTLTEAWRTADTVAFDLKLVNLAGHKFPSGYPSRRALVEFVVRDRNGDTLFASGVLGSDYEVIGQDAGYEPHYDRIDDPDQAQIYEFIMGDVNRNVTTTLERGDTLLKDNRLPPHGFTSTHPVYDTTKIGGLATSDPDFNRNGANEGTGRDIVHYRIPLGGYTDSLVVSARVWYQTVRPGWLDEMFANSSPDIDRFKRWFQQSDRSNVLVAEALRGEVLVSVEAPLNLDFSVFPNPSPDGQVFVGLPAGTDVALLRVYDLSGRELVREIPGTADLMALRLPAASGVYLVEIVAGGQRAVQRVLRQ
ncbi:MAG: T9SS type A sorting domain-containing protein [Bacteroidota bacterium]